MKEALLILIMIAGPLKGDPMKLVRTETGRVIAEIKDETLVFYSRFFERLVVDDGIFIPSLVRKEFDGKEVVFLGDPLFKKAFVEVYCRFVLPGSLYEWQP